MQKILGVMSVLMLLLALTVPTVWADNIENHENLYQFLVGDYIMIGKELNSEQMYYGKVVFAYHEDRFLVTRYIQGEIIQGEGKIEHPLGSDDGNVLRVRFIRSGQKYEITYLWQCDLDNYARLSGYVYHPGEYTDTPGLEALFIKHSEEEEESSKGDDSGK